MLSSYRVSGPQDGAGYGGLRRAKTGPLCGRRRGGASRARPTVAIPGARVYAAGGLPSPRGKLLIRRAGRKEQARRMADQSMREAATQPPTQSTSFLKWLSPLLKYLRRNRALAAQSFKSISSAWAPLSPLVKYMRRIGAGAALLGLATVMIAGAFWVGVGLVWLAFGCFLVDVLADQELHGHPWQKGSLFVLICVFVYIFSATFVFVSAPLLITCDDDPGFYPKGTVVDGIRWLPQYSAVDVTFHNFSSHTYDDLDMTVGADMTMVEAVQLTQISGVSIVPNGSQIFFGGVTKIGNEPPTESVASSLGPGLHNRYRVYCDRLPSMTSITVEIAVVDPRLHGGPLPANRIKRLVKRVSVDGRYRVLWRPHNISAKYTPYMNPGILKMMAP